MSSAELAARRTAAAACVADYLEDAKTADMCARAVWAARLADMLKQLLDALSAYVTDPPPAPGADRCAKTADGVHATPWFFGARCTACGQKGPL